MTFDTSGLRYLGGLWFEPHTGRLFNEDGEPSPFTFEDAKSRIWGSSAWVDLNPIGYATRRTAEAIREWVKSVIPYADEVEIVDLFAVGPLPRNVPERSIFVRFNNNSEKFNAGGLALIQMLRGDFLARQMFRAELKTAQIIP